MIDQLYRRPATGVLGAFARVMRGEAFFEVVGDAAVEGLVGALEEVAGPRGFGWWWHFLVLVLMAEKQHRRG